MVTACSTANHSIGESMRKIEYGDADVMVVGGSEVAGLRTQVSVVSTPLAPSPPATTIPAGASRPWDVDRDGFVLGEGSGVVIEELEHAKPVAQKIYCELVGYGVGPATRITSRRRARMATAPAAAC